jgi:hypothetical protein
MAADFTPLISSLKANLAETTAGPKPTSQFAPIITTINPSKTAPAVPHAQRSVSIEVKKDGERISQIRIQCRCGETIEVDCDY